jgi:hypothetical protein
LGLIEPVPDVECRSAVVEALREFQAAAGAQLLSAHATQLATMAPSLAIMPPVAAAGEPPTSSLVALRCIIFVAAAGPAAFPECKHVIELCSKEKWWPKKAREAEVRLAQTLVKEARVRAGHGHSSSRGIETNGVPPALVNGLVPFAPSDAQVYEEFVKLAAKAGITLNVPAPVAAPLSTGAFVEEGSYGEATADDFGDDLIVAADTYDLRDRRQRAAAAPPASSAPTSAASLDDTPIPTSPDSDDLFPDPPPGFDTPPSATGSADEFAALEARFKKLNG